MQWKPNVTVAAIAVRDEYFLLVEENVDNHIVFNQPAGHLEKNETLIEAVKREVLEETAWEFVPESLIGVYLYPNPHIDIIYLRFCFYGVCNKHFSDQPLADEILRVVWMSREEIESNRANLRSPMVLQCINDYLAGKRYPLNLLNHFISAG